MPGASLTRPPASAGAGLTRPPASAGAGPQTLPPPHMTTPRPCSLPGAGFAGAGLAGLVAIARGHTPDPIPNSAVKTLSAHGTATQGAEKEGAARPAISLSPFNTSAHRMRRTEVWPIDRVPHLARDQAV